VRATAGVNLYFAGLTAGAKVSPHELLAEQPAWPDFTQPETMRDAVRDIEAGLAVGARCAHDKLAHIWNQLLPYVMTICGHLEQTLPDGEDKPHYLLRALEARILSESDLRTPEVLHTVHGLRIELGAPLPRIEAVPHIERLYVRCQVDSITVCELSLRAPFSVPVPILARRILERLGVSRAVKTETGRWLAALGWMCTPRSASAPGWRARLKTAICIPALLHQSQLPMEDPLPENDGQVARVIGRWQLLSFQQAAADGAYVPALADSNIAGPHAFAAAAGPAPAIPVLMYHSIASQGPSALAQWRLSPDILAQQLKFLHEQGYYSVTSADCLRVLRDGKMLPGRPVVLTFDDGYCDFADNAWPLLREFGFRPEVFLVTDRVGGCASWDAQHGPPASLMDWDEIARLQAEGVIFGSHMATHRHSTALSVDELVEEAARSRFTLQARLGIQANNIAIPFGTWDPRLLRVLKWAGYEIGYTTELGAVSVGMNPLALPRVEITGDENPASFRNKLAAYAA
jgi:peptidoglycan/xylan/chitin deacetylase (PgdA/CDA1 family)